MVARWVGGARTAIAIAGIAVAALLAPSAVIAAEPAPPATDDVALQLAATPQGTLAPGDALALTFVVTNAGDTPVPAGSVTFAMTEHPFSDRSGLHDWYSGNDGPATHELTRITAPPVDTGTSSDPLTTQVAGTALTLPAGESSAVYGVVATLEANGQTVTGRTAFVWNPQPARASGLAVVLPVTAPTSVNGLIGASELRTFTAPTGILTRLLDGVSSHPDVTLAIDPRLIVSVRALGSAAPDSASAWLRRLEALPNPSFSLQFADADVTAQTQNGLTTLLKPSSFDYALDPSHFSDDDDALPETPTATPSPTDSATPTPTPAPEVPTLESLLAWPYTDTTIAWPPTATVRADDLAVLEKNGLTNTIVASSNTDASQLSTTPSAHVRTGDREVLLSDSSLSQALGAAAMATDDVAWSRAMGRLSTELASLGAENAPSTRVILATLPRGAWPSTGLRLSQTLTAVQTSSWSRPATLTEALTIPPATAVSLAEAAQPKERLAMVERLLDSEQRVERFSTVLTRPELLTGETRARLLALLATAWIEDGQDWSIAARQAVQQNADTTDSVRIVSSNESYNLLANEGSIPVTVTNALPYTVGVELHAIPSNGRLAVEQVSSKTIQPGSRGLVLVPVQAQVGNGRVQLSLQLTSQAGVPIGSTVVVPVTVNADWEGIGAFVVGGLLILLFGFGIVRNIRRRRPRLARRPGQEET